MLVGLNGGIGGTHIVGTAGSGQT